MKPTRCVYFALSLCAPLLLLPPGPAAAQPIKIDYGPTSLDGPVGRDGVFPVSGSQPTIVLGEFEFNDPSPNETNCQLQGWTSHDLTGQDGTFFHVDDFGGLGGGDYGRLVPLAGSQSLWCGARPSATLPLCEYGCLPGYGNGWNQAWCTAACLAVTGSVTTTFDISWDMEPGYDFVTFEYDECDENWVEFGGGVLVYDGVGMATGASHTIDAADHSGSVRIRIRASADGAFSDEDCFFNTDGAVIIDNLSVTDAGGTVLAVEDFEGEAVGAQASNDWNACVPPSYGDFACLFPGAGAVQEVADVDCNPTCAWGFVCGSAANYGCGPGVAGLQGSCDGPTALQSAVPYVNARGERIHNQIRSPWMAFTGPASYTTHMEFDVYRDLALDGVVFYDWRVRTRSVPGGCPEMFWQSDDFVYYGGVDWYTHKVDLDPFLGPAPAEIQVALQVRDLCAFWCGALGSGACHSHSPLFDNVRVYRENTQSWVVDDADLFQDSFPQNGTTTGTVVMDTPRNDYIVIRVTEPEFGIDYLVPGDPLSGPAVFLHVRNLPGKSGAVVSGGGQWPEVPSMSTPEWTVLQMSASSRHRYRVDVNDALYTPGDTVSFYFSARDAGGGVSYFSHEIGRTDNEAVAQANPMEATCLPAGGAAASGILYVDSFSGYGAEPYFMTAFDALGLEVDRFDRRGPSLDPLTDNSLGNLVADVSTQLGVYDVIVWNTGTSGVMTSADYGALWGWLQLAPDDRGLYLSGDDAADNLVNSGDASANAIVSNYIDCTVTHSSHKGAGEPTSPLVLGEVGGIFDDGAWVDTLVALGTTPAMNDFDVLQPSGTAVLQATYSGNASHGAVVSQVSQNPQAAQIAVVLSGFSFHHIRDNTPAGATTDVMDRYEHLHDILVALGTIASTPTGGGGDPRYATTLAQNVPNPFNPVTTISYSLRESAPVRMVIYDVSGARVRTLVDERDVPAGQHTVEWDGTDDRGTRVASGVYFYRMATTGFGRTRKMVLLK